MLTRYQMKSNRTRNRRNGRFEIFEKSRQIQAVALAWCSSTNHARLQIAEAAIFELRTKTALNCREFQRVIRCTCCFSFCSLC